MRQRCGSELNVPKRPNMRKCRHADLGTGTPRDSNLSGAPSELPYPSPLAGVHATDATRMRCQARPLSEALFLH